MENQEKNSNKVNHQVDLLLRKIEKLLEIKENTLTLERLDLILSLKDKLKQ